jgi:hydrophobe/amphiphile efflux-1 (HAE1) family protein
MKITEISLKKPIFAWMIMFSFLFFGFMSLQKLGISEKPDVDNPVVTISVVWTGAAPEVVELDIIDILESNLLSVEGIKSMVSTARRGRAEITLEFGLNKDIDVAVQEVQAILGQAGRRLPKDIEPPIVLKSNPEDRPIIWLSITSTKFTKKELMTYVRDQIKDRFQTVEGVAEVILGGYVDPNLRIWVDDKKLKQYDLAVADLLNTITKEHAEYPAGLFETPLKESNIRVLGEALSPEEFSKLAINQRAGAPNYSPIALGDVARVEDGLDDQRRISRVMGDMSIGLGFRKQRGTNSVAVAQRVKEKMQQLEPMLPEGASIGINFDSTLFIEDSINELKFTLLLSGIMTSLVVWFFLGSFGAAINIMLSIPTAIMATFMAIYAFGFTLNTFTMLGLTLAVGLVVDDNIMILENISRVYKNGLSKIQASLKGTNEISFAALASSTAIIAIFLPLGFVSGIVGRYFYEFAVTLCAAIFFSYIDAVTLTPMRTSYLLGKDKEEGHRFIDRAMLSLEAFYVKLLNWTLDHKKIVFAIGLLIALLTVWIVTGLKREFTPAQDQSRLIMFMKTPVGSSLSHTEKKVAEIEKLLLQEAEVQRYFVAIGGFTGVESNTAFSYVTLKAKDQRPINKEKNKVLTQQEWMSYFRQKIMQNVKGIFVFMRDPSLGDFGGTGTYPIEFSLTGNDFEELIKASEIAKQKLKDSTLMVDIDSNFQGRIPELLIIPDRQKAMQRGVSIETIGQTIQAMVGGIVAGKFSQGGRRFDVRLKMEENSLGKLENISNINVRNNRGELIALSEVTKIVEEDGLLSVTREDRARAIRITANLAPKVAQSDALSFVRSELREALPEGIALIESGNTKTYNESFDSLVEVLVLGIIIAFMVLASQFNSFLHPITVLSVLPFSFTGAFIALKVGDQSLNIYSMIGLILLMGIVKKNSIILVDYTNQMRSQGMSVKDALMQACPIRLRPIVMTSASTIAGTLPAALALGPGAETRIPMALAVIGGLTLSTVLTLFIVPTLYSVIPGKVDLERESL